VSLSLAEARTRAALVHDVRTTVHLDLTGTESYALDATLSFGVRTPGATTFVELAGARGVTLEGADATYADGRITLTDLSERTELRIRATMPYVTDGDGMFTFTDPVDGERYLCAYTSMDVAQKVIPCFDQPDVKSTFTVSVTAPNHWTVLANGRLSAREGDTWHFTTTPAISTYLFFVCGGPWASITWDEPYAPAPGGTLPFGWHARASQRDLLERDADELRRVTSACFAHYTSAFDEPYPFDDYQQVLAPGLNWGAMEFPGCVAFRDEMLTPGQPTAMERHWRSSVIAHEMAHMWFGNLVTMRWWEDSWLNESFADFMGYEVAARATGADAWTAAALQRKPTAFWADRRRSTHPVAEDAENLVDVDTAFANFDMITYAKGNALLRQLVFWLGEEDFLAGVNAHLSAHPFGNASLADFLDALDAATDRDVRAWAQAHLRTTGFDRIVVRRDGDVPVLHREGTRPHRLTVTAYDDGGAEVGSRVVDLEAEPVGLAEFAGAAVLPNAGDETYAELVLDEDSWQRFERALGGVPEPLARAVLWRTAASRAERGEISPTELAGLAVRHLPAEEDATVLEGALTLVERVLTRHGSDTDAPRLSRAMASLGEHVLAAGDATRVPVASRLLARHGDDAEQLLAWLAGESDLPEADQSVRWQVVTRLSALGHPEHVVLEEQRDPSQVGRLAALTARAAEPTAAAKQAAWEQLASGTLSNREVTAVAAGLWRSGGPELLSPWLLATPDLLVTLARTSGQGMGGVLGKTFPWLPLPTELRHQLRDALAETLAGDDVPTVVGRALADHLDDLDLVIAAAGSSAGPTSAPAAGRPGLATLGDRLADWLEELGLLDHLAEAGLPTVQRNCSGQAVWRDPGTGDPLTQQQLLELDRLLHQEGDEPVHAVPVPLLQLARRAKVRADLLASPWHTYETLASLRGTSVDATRFWVHKSAQGHGLLVVPLDERVLVPGFQLDGAGEVRGELVEVLAALLSGGVEPWAAWGWLTQPAALLGGLVPERAAADPEEAPLVRHAAVRLAGRTS
jgi:aminopeptidase N